MTAARLDWRTSTPTELLDGNAVLTLSEVAYILGLVHIKGAHKGEPSIAAAAKLVHEGKLAPVDPSQPVGRLTVSCATVRRYLDGTPSLALVRGAA